MKVLLPRAGEKVHYYRANLHCHTTVSDGRKTPEEVKAYYKENGYSVVAFTDHDIMVPHNDLTDEDFLALNGYEIEVNQAEKQPCGEFKCCHFCLVALEPDNDLNVCYHRSQYVWGNALAFRPTQHIREDEPDYVREYSTGRISDMMKKAREAGYFVTYNHPVWSLEEYPDYIGYENMNAFEMVNYSCLSMGFEDDNGRVYNDMLRSGKRLFCIAADDNHNGAPDDSPNSDSFGGSTMIAAEKLEYRTVTRALEEGRFYARGGNHFEPGPEILGLFYEDGKVTIKTSPAREISLITSLRHCQCRRTLPGECVEEASFILPKNTQWFRLVVADQKGLKSYTNAYFTDNL